MIRQREKTARLIAEAILGLAAITVITWGAWEISPAIGKIALGALLYTDSIILSSRKRI